MESAEDSMGLRVASFAYYLDSAKDNYKMSKSNSKPTLNVTSFSSSRDSQDSLANLRVDSFSYRNTSENFVFKVPGPVQDPTASFSFCQEIPKDGEINVFSADRYFNMKPEHQAGALKHGFKNKTMAADIPFLAPNSRLRTPSLYSEESSWNGQAALFPGLTRMETRPKQKKTFGQRIFAGFGCPGPCFHRKDVCINEMVADGTAYYGSKPTRTGCERVDTLAFIPPPNLVTEDTLAVKKQLQILEESRNSIEVFGSGSAASFKGDVATNMERKLSMLTWDAIPKGAQSHKTSTIGHSTFCDDMASDASSDLFEIENMSGSMYLPQTTDQATDDQVSSCMSPISHYAPSEASIQWSVVTASAADFSSVLSFNDETSVGVAEDVLGKNIASGGSSKTRGREAKEGPKTRPGGGGILRCKNYRAVEVAENACLNVPNQDFHSRQERFYKELHV